MIGLLAASLRVRRFLMAVSMERGWCENSHLSEVYESYSKLGWTADVDMQT
jgi:hypothetical protein